MNVVAGKYRGRKLLSPKGDSVRPTTTRIKETIFNVLQGYIADCLALDLFAGSGALGIECISRGAREVIFADRSKDSVALVKQNLQGIDGNYTVICNDFAAVLHALRSNGRRFDVIFLDPPYLSKCGEEAIDIIIEGNLLNEGGVIVFEHGSEKTYTLKNTLYRQRTKKMGTVTAEFIYKKRVALMTGSFDPVTKGHEEVLKEALKVYDEVVVACLINPDKKYTFNGAQRLVLAQAMCSAYPGARAVYSENTAVETAREVGAEKLVRGIRNTADESYETEMAAYNRAHGIETHFIIIDECKDITSTLVREQIERGDLSNLPDAAAEVIKTKEFSKLK